MATPELPVVAGMILCISMFLRINTVLIEKIDGHRIILV